MPDFSFEEAEHIELRTTFINQSELVFLNVPAKGYDKDSDVRYALSSDEFLLEVRDKSFVPRGKQQHKVKRICKTLTHQVDVARSEVQLLVDFIVVKLHKQESGQHWREFGYDISTFTNPERGQMKSNFLKSVAPATPEPKAQDTESTQVSEGSAPVEEKPAEKTEEELELERKQRIHDAMHRARNAAHSYLNLQTSAIFEIY